MNRNLLHFFLIATVFVISSIAASCSNDEPKNDTDGPKERLILLYAVAANNLVTVLPNDTDEIKQAGPFLDLERNKVLVYSVDYSNKCTLHELVKDRKKGTYKYSLVDTFPELPLSTSKERIAEVIDYVDNKFPYPYKGLILWSHGTGWLPWENGSTPGDGKKKAFGDDKYPGTNGIVYKTDINELADAIPSGVFDFIWFDCCYMANIETVYELRNKTDYIVGYVEEIGAAGMPYDLTMPYLLKVQPDLESAANMVLEYYDSRGMTGPVSIVRTDRLENLAAKARAIFINGTAPSSLKNIQNYATRDMSKGVYYFYDMGQLLTSYSGVDALTKEDFEKALEEAVVYKICNEYDLPGPYINPMNYSGLSMHHFIDNGSFQNNYYKTLDWYKATR